jgi:hypothetical protein
MNKRIALQTHKPGERSHNKRHPIKYTEIKDAADLKAKLAGMGAKRIALAWTDRLGDGHREGKIMDVDALTDVHVEWLCKPEPATMRSLYYDTTA